MICSWTLSLLPGVIKHGLLSWTSPFRLYIWSCQSHWHLQKNVHLYRGFQSQRCLITAVVSRLQSQATYRTTLPMAPSSAIKNNASLVSLWPLLLGGFTKSTISGIWLRIPNCEHSFQMFSDVFKLNQQKGHNFAGHHSTVMASMMCAQVPNEDTCPCGKNTAKRLDWCDVRVPIVLACLSYHQFHPGYELCYSE